MTRKRNLDSVPATSACLSIVLATCALAPLTDCPAQAQAVDPPLLQQLVSSPGLQVVAPALLNQFLPVSGTQPISSAAVKQLTSAGGVLRSSGVNSMHSLQTLQSRLSTLKKLESASSTLTNVMVGVAAGAIVGAAVYRGVKCYRANRKTKQEALLAQQQYFAEQNELLAQRQKLNEQLAEGAAASSSASDIEAAPATDEGIACSASSALHLGIE